MYAYEVRNMKWENFPKERIAKIPRTFRSNRGMCICREDVINFLNNLFDEIDEMISAKRSVVYILKEENVQFFCNLEDFFYHKQQAANPDCEEFVKIMTSLRLPVIDMNSLSKSKLEKTLEMYTQLSEDEKKEFFNAVGAKPE